MLHRTLTLSSGLSAEQREHLRRALVGALEKQAVAAAASPRIAVATSVEFEDDAVRLEYTAAPGAALTLEGGPWPERDLIALAQQFCQAFLVAYPIDEAPFLPHGGLTPACVLRNEADQTLWITDFGVALAFLSVPGIRAEFRLDPIAAYVAPEVWRTPQQLGQPADLFSVGVILYQLATGAHPYEADPADPDQCRWQMMVELPVKAQRVRESLSPAFAQWLDRLVASQLVERFRSFAEAADVLVQIAPSSALPPTVSPRKDSLTYVSSGSVREGTVTSSLAAEAERRKRAESVRQQEVRRKAEAAVLSASQQETLRRTEERLSRTQDERLQRAAAELAARRQRDAARRSWLRRNWPQLAIGAFVAAMALGGSWLWWVRSANADVLLTQAQRIKRGWHRALTEPVRDESVMKALGFSEDGPNLRRAIDCVVATGLTQGQIDVRGIPAGWTRAAGTLRLAFGDVSRLDIPVLIDRQAGVLRMEDEAEQLARLVDATQEVAKREVHSRRKSFMDRLTGAIDSSERLAELSRHVAALGVSPAQWQLGWVGFYAGDKRLELARYQVPDDPTDDQVEVEWRVTDVEAPAGAWPAVGQVVLAHGAAPSIISLTIETPEPRSHAEWCLSKTTAPLRSAFAARDVEALLRLAEDRVVAADAARMFAWLDTCAPSALDFEPLDEAGDGAVQAVLRYTVQLPGETTALAERQRCRLVFDPASGWRLIDLSALIQPAAPPRVAARDFLRDVLADPAQHLGGRLGTSGPAAADIAKLLNSMKATGLTGFAADDVAFDAQRSRLTFRLRPEGTDGWVAQPLTFEFSTAGAAPQFAGSAPLIWTRRSEDDAFARACERLFDTHWDVAALEAVVSQVVTLVRPEQRAALDEWVAAIRQLSAKFGPADGARWEKGLPDRIRFDLAPSHAVSLRLVPANPPVYLMEREITTADYAVRGAAPPSDFAALEEYLAKEAPRPRVDGAPAVTYVSYDAALTFAESLGMTLPSADEWLALRTLAGAEEADFSPGGVVEWCRPGDGAVNSVEAAVIGRAWLVDDAALSRFAPERDNPESPGVFPRERGDATIGFRLALRLDLPKKVRESQAP